MIGMLSRFVVMIYHAGGIVLVQVPGMNGPNTWGVLGKGLSAPVTPAVFGPFMPGTCNVLPGGFPFFLAGFAGLCGGGGGLMMRLVGLPTVLYRCRDVSYHGSNSLAIL